MTEKDLGLKTTVRRLFWRWGYSTKVDVGLRAVVRESGTATSRTEMFTDLDVLGISVAQDLTVRSVVADCKTSQRRSTERMFWLRGVGDYFGADEALLIRENAVTRASRVLAARLDLAIATEADLVELEMSAPSDVPLDTPPLALLFDVEHVASSLEARATVDAKLKPLVEYLELDYWLYDEHRNLQQLVAHLEDAASVLDAKNPVHASLFAQSAWTYLVSIAKAVQYIRRVHVTELDKLLRAYLFGGEAGLRDKQNLAQALRQATGRLPANSLEDDVLPPYYRPLLETVTRYVGKPGKIQAGLRYAEWLTESLIAKERATVQAAFVPSFDDVAAKLLLDLSRLLVNAAGLDRAFLDGMTRRLVTEAPGRS